MIFIFGANIARFLRNLALFLRNIVIDSVANKPLLRLQDLRPNMKNIIAIIMLLVSTSALAQRPDCSKVPGECGEKPPGLEKSMMCPYPAHSR